MAPRHSSSSGRSSYYSRSGARSQEFEATADRIRRQVEDPDREPSVIPLNQEDRQGEEKGTTNRELGRGRPVLNLAATDLLKTLQQLRADRKQQIDTFIQTSKRESNSALREQDRLSIELETQKFHDPEEGVRKFLEGGP